MEFSTAELKIMDITGREIYTKQINEMEKMLSVQLTGISKGIYTLQLFQLDNEKENILLTKKLVIE